MAAPVERSRWLGRGAVAAIVAIVFLASSDSKRTAGIRSDDLLDTCIPLADLTHRALSAGRVPMWNPEVGCGIPVIWSQAPYPPNWIFALLPARVGMAILVVFHLLVAGLGMYGWLRLHGAGAGPAVLGSSALVFGLVGQCRWPMSLYTIAWTPLLFLILDMPGSITRWRWLALTLCSALQILAGHIQHLVYLIVLILAYLSVRAIRDRRISHLLHAGAAFVLAMAIACPFWLPVYRHISTASGRSLSHLSPDEVHYSQGGAPTERKLSQLGRMLPKIAVNGAKARVLVNRFSYGYLGIIVPVAILAALLTWRTWRGVFWLVAMAAGLYLCMGFSPGLLPVYEGLSRLPIIGTFRSPDRLLVWYLFGAAFLTGIGAERIRSGLSPGVIQKLLLMVCVALIGLRVVVWVRLGRGGGLDGGIWLLGILVAVAMLIAPGRGGSRGSWVRGTAGIWLLVIISLVDIWRSCAFVCPYIDFPKSWYSEIAYRGRRLMTRGDLERLDAAAGDKRLYRWYICERYRPINRTSLLRPFRTVPFYMTFPPRRLSELAMRLPRPVAIGWLLWAISPDRHRRLFDSCSVRAIATWSRIEDAESRGWRYVCELSLGAHVYVNDRALPRASLWSKYELVTPSDALAEIASEAGTDEGRDLLLEEAPSDEWVRQREPREGPVSETSPGDVEFLADEPERVVLRVKCKEPVLLLLTDTYTAGWRCKIDDQAVPIRRANYLHRAVEVLPGEHIVEFGYSPPGLKAGACVSGIAVLALVAVAVSSLITRGRSGQAASKGAGEHER